MNSTPNYQFEKNLNINICALDGVDRELKRLEGRVDATDSALSNRYTKEEVDCKVSSKADRCAFEKHLMDPDAHQELFDGKVDKKEGCRLFCAGDEKRLDDLDAEVEKKASIEPPVEYQLKVTQGHEAGRRSTYWKDAFSQVHIGFEIIKTNGYYSHIDDNESIVTVLPEGFRPRSEILLAVNGTKGVERSAGVASIFPDGKVVIRFHPSLEITNAYGNGTFLAAL